MFSEWHHRLKAKPKSLSLHSASLLAKFFVFFFNDTPQPLNVTPLIKNMFDVIFGLYFDMAAADDCLHATSTRWIYKKKKKNTTWTANSLFVAQFLALIIIIAATCHFFHYNTVRAVPVTVWEDG